MPTSPKDPSLNAFREARQKAELAEIERGETNFLTRERFTAFFTTHRDTAGQLLGGEPTFTETVGMQHLFEFGDLAYEQPNPTSDANAVRAVLSCLTGLLLYEQALGEDAAISDRLRSWLISLAREQLGPDLVKMLDDVIDGHVADSKWAKEAIAQVDAAKANESARPK